MTVTGDNKVWYLRRLDLFLSLTDPEIEALARMLDDRHIPANTELLQEKQREQIFIVKTGAIRLYITDHGQQVTLGLLGPGRMFGLSAQFGYDNPAIGAVTLESSYICFATMPKMLELLGQFPETMLRMVQALGEQIFLAETWIERTTALSSRVRLANLLLDLCDEFCEAHAAGLAIRFRVTQSDLARMISLTRETVSRHMADFSRAGWVSNQGGVLVIRDRDALLAVARGAEPSP